MPNRIIRVGIDDAPTVPMQLGNPEMGDFRGYEMIDGNTSKTSRNMVLVISNAR